MTILNVNDKEVILPSFTPDLLSLSDYSIYQFNNSNHNVDRVQKLYNELQPRLIK